MRVGNDESITVLQGKDGGLIIVGVYVDDLLVTVMNVEHVADFFKEIEVLEVKNLGSASRLYGISRG